MRKASSRCRQKSAHAAPPLAFLPWGGNKATSTSTRSPQLRSIRQQLLKELSSPKPDLERVSKACDALLEAEVSFDEAQLGGGPFHAVYTRGPLLWALWTSQARQGGRATKPADNQASLPLASAGLGIRSARSCDLNKHI
jgi:hypothetical protein